MSTDTTEPPDWFIQDGYRDMLRRPIETGRCDNFGCGILIGCFRAYCPARSEGSYPDDPQKTQVHKP